MHSIKKVYKLYIITEWSVWVNRKLYITFDLVEGTGMAIVQTTFRKWFTPSEPKNVGSI